MPNSSTNTIRVCLLLLAGGFAAQHSRVLPDSDLWHALFVAIAGLLVVHRCRYLGVFLLGFAIFAIAGQSILEQRLDAQFEGDSMLAEVRIVDFPRFSGKSLSMLVEPLADSRLPSRSRVSWFDPSSQPKLGEIWALELRLRRPRGSSNPGVFNTEDWMFRERILASGYVVPGPRNKRLGYRPPDTAFRVRRSFVEFAQESSSRSAPVIAALGVGARHLLTPAAWDRYALTGTSHLMAISGLHVGLAASAVLFFVATLSGLLRLPGNHLIHGMLVATLVAAAYAWLSGLAVPSQRATLMLVLLALTFVLRRRPNPLLVIAQASITIYIVDPIALLRPGFGLSFTAVVVLLWLANVNRRLQGRPGVLAGAAGALRSLLAVQLALLVGLLPLTTLTFQRIAIAAPIVNMLAVPVFSLVTVPLTLLSLALYVTFPGMADLLLRVVAASVALVEYLIAVVAAIPAFDLPLATSGLNWLLVGTTWLWLLIPRGCAGRWIGLLAVAWIACFRPGTPPPSCFETHVLDVGQGLAVVVQSASHTLLFDTGASYRGGGSAASRVVVPFLHNRGTSAVDWLIVSHADNDHSGGVVALHQQMRIGEVYAGEMRGDLPGQARLCEAGAGWSSDGVEFEFLYPAGGPRRSGNNASCVLLVAAGEHRLLLTGDIEAAAERDLVSGSYLQAVDVVVVPHHGSLTSSTPDFVARTRPGIAISSAAYGNRWGFPQDAVTQRWRDAGAKIMDTANSGAISFMLCADNGLRALRSNRIAERRFWHAAAPE